MMKKLRSLGVVSCILAVIYLITWLIGLILLWTGIDRNGLFYGVVLVRGLLPADTFIFSLWIGTREISGKRKWSAPIIFGMAFILNCICALPLILLTPSGYPGILKIFFSATGASYIGLTVGLGIKRIVQAVRDRKSK